jgi:hypothetical protein
MSLISVRGNGKSTDFSMCHSASSLSTLIIVLILASCDSWYSTKQHSNHQIPLVLILL